MPKTDLDATEMTMIKQFASPYNIDSIYNYELSKTYWFFDRCKVALFLLRDTCPRIPDKIIEVNLDIITKIASFFLQKKRTKRFVDIYGLYSNKLACIREKKKGRKSIYVYFMVLYEHSFASKPLFEKMVDDCDFIPRIIVTPDVLRDHNGYESSYMSLKKKYGEYVIKGYDEDGYISVPDDCDIIIFSSPYARMIHSAHNYSSFLDKNILMMYVNYGFTALKFNINYVAQTDFFNSMWLVVTDSKDNYNELVEKQPLQGKNVLYCSYVKMDQLRGAETRCSNEKTILICPHHSVDNKLLSLSNFLKYSDFILKLPLLYPSVTFIVRPHPLLFFNIQQNGIWAESEVQNYIAELKSYPNVQFDQSEDYFEVFEKCDAMIHDCGSFVGEFLFTEKPCCYVLKSKREIKQSFSIIGQKCLDVYYKAYDENDILSFIDSVVIAGNDPLKEKRVLFSKRELKTTYPYSSEVILEYIKEQIY